MPKVTVLDMAGKEVSKIDLSDAVFGIEPNKAVMHDLVKNYLANQRQGTQSALTRAEVSGGGKKPWKQKGTGRARFGSSRNPIWRGGGVVFGPRGNENYTKKLSKTAKKVAVRQALTVANEAKKIVVKDVKTTGKTKEVATFLADNKFERRILIVVDEKTPELMRATNNIQNVLVVRANYLSVYHILNADTIVITPKALPVITAWLGKEEA